MTIIHEFTHGIANGVGTINGAYHFLPWDAGRTWTQNDGHDDSAETANRGIILASCPGLAP